MSFLRNAELAQAIDDTRRDLGDRAMARMIGVADTTIGRRGSELSIWPVESLLTLSDHNERIRLALAARVSAADSTSPTDARRTSSKTISSAATLIADIASDMADGFDEREARNLIPEIQALEENLKSMRAAMTDVIKKGAGRGR